MSLPVLSSSLQPLVISESTLPSQPYTTTTSPLSTDASPQPSSRTVKCLQTSNLLSESTHGENSECRQFKPDASPQPTSKTIKSSPFTKPTQIKTTKLSASSQNPDASTNYSLRAMIQEHIVSSPMPKQTKVETTKQPLPSNKSNSVSVRQKSGISTSLVSTSNIPDIDFNSTLPTVEEQTGITSPGASTNFKYVCPHCNKSYRQYASLYVLGSEKIRLMEQKMNFEILASALSPGETLQNELSLMKIGQSSQKIQSFEVESQHSV